MRIGFFLLLSIWYGHDLFANSSLPTCSMKSICEQFRAQRNDLYFYSGDEATKVPNFHFLKTHSEGYQSSEDPFLNPNLFAKAEFQKSYEEASLRSEVLFNETQANVLQFLKRKRAHFTEIEYQGYVQKVKTVRLSSILDPKIRKLAAGACQRPNAIYIRGFHELLICPNLMNMPNQTLKKVIAHELGHAIQGVQEKIACLQKFPARQSEEAFADWVSSEVISEDLRQEKNQKVAKKKALESQMLFLSVACFATESQHSYSYPSIQNRMEKIFLAQSAFQEVLRCKNPNVPHCE